jgi:GLPGLI family protein
MKIFLLAASLAASAVATAQTTEGTIIYERKINMHKRLPPEAEQFKAMVPEFQTSKMELSFKGNQSLYKPAKVAEDEMPSTEPGGGGGGGFGRMMMRFGGGDGESFKNYETGLATDIRELGPKKYLLDDTLKRISWKMSPDTMTIMGHLCHKATAVQKDGIMGMMGQRMGGGGGNRQGGQPTMAGAADSGRTRMNDSTRTRMMATLTQPQQIVAWYADDIASPAGPDAFYGLPGVIMKLDIDEGFMVYTPLEISAKAGTVKAPTSGKKITREEYGKMMMEQAQMMRGMGGGMRITRPM